MKIGILKEQDDRRVALAPDALPKLQQLGIEVLLERGAGEAAMFPDEAYAETATIADRKQLFKDADVLISISPLSDKELGKLAADKYLISQFAPFSNEGVGERLREKGLHAMSLDMIPRTTIAQDKDVLSSMASIAGYQAAIVAARHLPRYFPMMITAAGSLRPATVLVLGAGVAGLQAIATAKRLGASVEAFDTRSAAKEEVKSLGAKFIEVEGAREDTSAGGYAVEQDEDFLKRQRAEVQSRAQKSDVIITTAQVRGRKAPILVPEETVQAMKTGSVIVDLAASTGGNCALTENGSTVVKYGVTIVGDSNLPAQMPQDASQLYSNNLFNFLKHIAPEGALDLDMEDQIVRDTLITAKSE